MRKALLIGIDDYAQAPLNCCVNDAVAVNTLLERNGDGSPNFDTRLETNKHRCINFYINKFQIPSPTLRGVAKRPLILADMTFLTRLRSSEIPPLIVLAA